MKRKEGQKKGYLGHRSHGRGNVKNRRGSGNRGGRGMAGIDKHKWSWAMVYDKNHFDKHGFVPPTHRIVKVAHLYQINQDALLNKIPKKGDKFQFDFDGKILATGDVTLPLEIRAVSWSKNVEKKLKESGGHITKHPDAVAAAERKSKHLAVAAAAAAKGSSSRPGAAKPK